MGFKWRKLYSTLIGLGIWLIPIYALIINFDPEDESTYGRTFGLMFLWLFVWGFVSLFVAKKLNRVMMAKTGTNEDIIRGFLNGEYDYMIPSSLNNDAGRLRIYKILSTGMATSMKGAVLMARKKNIDRKIGKVALAGTALAVHAGNRMTEKVWGDFGDAVGGAIESMPNYFRTPNAPQTVDRTWQITQEKNRAVFMETQAKNAAMADLGSYDARRKDNLAKQQRYKADHM